MDVRSYKRLMSAKPETKDQIYDFKRLRNDKKRQTIHSDSQYLDNRSLIFE